MNDKPKSVTKSGKLISSKLPSAPPPQVPQENQNVSGNGDSTQENQSNNEKIETIENQIPLEDEPKIETNNKNTETKINKNDDEKENTNTNIVTTENLKEVFFPLIINSKL
jgi:hypothetical protein